MFINYKMDGSNTGDLVWKPSDSSCQTNIFNQFEIIDPSKASQDILHSAVIDTAVDATNTANSPKK